MSEKNWHSGLSRTEKKFFTLDYEYIWPLLIDALGLRALHFKKLADIMDIHPGDTVVELGAGYPLYLFYTAKCQPKGQFISIDCLPNIQGRSKKILALLKKIRPHLPPVQLLTADATSLPLPDKSVNVIVASNLPFLNKHYFTYVAEAWRVLAPMGKIYWSFVAANPHGVVNTIGYMINRAGFQNLDIKSTSVVPIAFGALNNWLVSAEKP